MCGDEVQLAGRPSAVGRRRVVDGALRLGLRHAVDNEFDMVRERPSPPPPPGRRRDLPAPFPHSPARRLETAGGDLQSSSVEWQDLARIVDRLFFWLFMVSSVGLLTCLYVSVADR